MPIIEVKNLTKEYQLGSVTGIKDNLRHTLAKLRGKPTWERERFKALDDVSFSIEEGEVVGIIGHNGAGKSTLLKHLANISKPTQGEVIVRGSIAPLIEVGAGVNPELTGRENIFLNGAILGIPKKIINSKLDEIIEFSELEQFIDTPVKRYSSGMTVKLGFSIATSMDSDILIIDEVLAVGDLAFQRKCFDRMEDMIKRQGKTVLIVSHNIRQIERLCTRVMMLDHGKVLMDDLPNKVCNEFYRQNDERIFNQNHISSKVQKTDEVDVIDFSLFDENGEQVNSINYLSSPYIKIKIRAHKIIKKPIFIIGIHTTDFIYIATKASGNDIKEKTLAPGDHEWQCTLTELPFLPGPYSLRFSIDRGDNTTNIYYGENLARFNIVNKELNRTGSNSEGFISLETIWKCNKSVRLLKTTT